jgi:hypothetical protein
MTEPPRFPMDDLWRRLADAQDAMLDARNSPSRVSEALTREGPFRPPPRRRLRTGLALGAASMAVIVVAFVAVMARRAPLRLAASGTAPAGVTGRDLRADARSDLPLQFSDGSTITFRAGSAGSLQRLTRSGADVLLERGRLDAHVVHADATLWLVHAGPFRVRVTGTRFAVGWLAPRLTVAVYEGAVVVDGASLGAGIPLRAGQRLTVDGGVVRTESLAAAAVPGWPDGPAGRTSANDSDRAGSSEDGVESETGPFARRGGTSTRGSAVDAPRSLTAGPSRGRDWMSPAERGDYSAALSIARHSGWNGLCAHLGARKLLMLGDVARYAGAPSEADRAFRSLIGRFPRDRLAADAAFSLGRLAFEAGKPGEAARWFRRYVDDWPNGPLAEQALGRLVECAMRMDDRAAARNAADAYLARAPNGPHAPLAHQVLTAGSDGPP